MNTKEAHGTLAFGECCQRVLRSPKTDGYAKAYAKAGLSMTDREMIRVQALYILSNIEHWRSDDAKMVRTELKYWAGL